jgi:hypothetical protein
MSNAALEQLGAGIASASPKTVLCIPGPWKNLAALTDALAAVARNGAGKNYLILGDLMLDLASTDAVNIVFQAADPRMAGAFRAATAEFSSAQHRAIERHVSVVYLISIEHSLARANALLLAASAILETGGLAVKVESAGIAYTSARWHSFGAAASPAGAHQAYVGYVLDAGDDALTRGMHNLGAADAVVARADSADPLALLRQFTWYLLAHAPTIEPGQSFALDASGPHYLLRRCTELAASEASALLRNPFGRWRLERTH